MNPENFERPIVDANKREQLVEERGAINDELMKNAAANTLSPEAIEEKERRLAEIAEVLASTSN